MKINLWARFEKFPPILCRLMARVKNGRPLETNELAKMSGLSASTVLAISSQLDWRGVDVPTARSFLVACGMDLSNPDHMRRVRQRLRAKLSTPNGRFKYLKLSPNYDAYYAPLLAEFYASMRK